jgi:hypothetical protein
MKYSMVKQFSNGAMDNIYNFFFKWVDFGKVLLEVFWAFLEIWQAFSLIFYNIAMYFYYLFLFFIDRGTEETQASRIFRRPISKRLSSTPSIRLTPEIGNPVPAAYGKAATAVAKTADTVAAGLASISTPPRNPLSGKAGGKRNTMKSMAEFFSDLGARIGKIFMTPMRGIVNFFADRIRPVKEEDHPAEPKKRSLIDEYMKEYEKERGN